MIEQPFLNKASHPEVPTSEQNPTLEYLIDQRQEELQSVLQDGATFKAHLGNAQRVYTSYSDINNEKEKKIEAACKEVEWSMIGLDSSLTVATVYLKMREELGGQLSDSEFAKLFIECVELNSERHRRMMNLSNAERRAVVAGIIEGKHNRVTADIDAQVSRKPLPSWFQGNRNEWKSFYSMHSNFGHYLHLGSVTIDKATAWKKVWEIKRSENTIGYTMADQYPDWFFDLNQNLPDEVQVIQEMKEDENEHDTLQSLQKEYIEQSKKLNHAYDKKWIKAANHFEVWRRNLEAKNTNLFNTILYLDAAEFAMEYEALAQDDSMESVRAYENSLITSEQSKKRIKEEFINNYRFNPEVVALWLNEGLMTVRDGDLHQSVQRVLEWLGQERSSEELYALKEQDKKLHSLVKYELTPFFEVMSSDEKKFILELGNSGQIPPQTISDIAEIFSQYLNVGMLANNPRIEQEIKKTAVKWLGKAGDKEFVNKLKDYIGRTTGYRYIYTEGGTADEISEQTGGMMEIVKEEEEKIRRTSLANWNVLWIRDYNKEGKSTPVEGASLGELEKKLDNLFLENGESYSIKTSSIVNALDWFLGVPEEIKRLWIKEEIDGVEYYKIKRGAVRIFCQIDAESKAISFFPYQKKAMGYAFRS